MAKRSKSNSTGNATFTVQVKMGKGAWTDHSQHTAVTACNKESFAVVKRWLAESTDDAPRAYKGRPDCGYTLLQVRKDEAGNKVFEEAGYIRIKLDDPILLKPVIGQSASLAAKHETLRALIERGEVKPTTPEPAA